MTTTQLGLEDLEYEEFCLPDKYVSPIKDNIRLSANPFPLYDIAKDKFSIIDFKMMFSTSKVFENYDSMLEAVSKEVPRCLWYFIFENKHYVKISETEVVKQKFNHKFFYQEGSKKKSITFEQLALDPNSNIMIYEREVLQPKKEKVYIHDFNLFSGFSADVEIENFNEEKYNIAVKAIKAFLLKTICNGCEVSFNFLISWIHCLCITPWRKTRRVLVLYSKNKHNKAKVSFCSFIFKLIGNKYCDIVTKNKRKVTQDFYGKFLVVLDNLETAKLSAFKSQITEKYTTVKQKGKDLCCTDSFVNFIFTTNNKPTFITKSDFRYVPIHVSEKYAFKSDYFQSKKNEAYNEYWTNVDENILTAHSAMYFFRWLKSLNPSDLACVNSHVDTPFRRELDVI